MCGNTSQFINHTTVEALSGFSTESNKMFACLNPVCEIVYFGEQFYPLIFKQHIQRSLHFKEDTLKYICYCHNITYEDVYFGVMRQNKRTVKSFMTHGKRILVEQCIKKNPFGCSCTVEIQRYITILLKEHHLV